jgi:hypothetical protein
MKKFTLTWLCLTLTTAFALAADYRLVRTQMLDGEPTERSGVVGKVQPTVYVLIQPGGRPPIVFQKFDSQQMEAWLGLLSLRERGIVVHFHASALVEPSPSAAEWDAFKTFCQKHDITLINESDAD